MKAISMPILLHKASHGPRRVLSAASIVRRLNQSFAVRRARIVVSRRFESWGRRADINRIASGAGVAVGCLRGG